MLLCFHCATVFYINMFVHVASLQKTTFIYLAAWCMLQLCVLNHKMYLTKNLLQCFTSLLQQTSTWCLPASYSSKCFTFINTYKPFLKLFPRMNWLIIKCFFIMFIIKKVIIRFLNHSIYRCFRSFCWQLLCRILIFEDKIFIHSIITYDVFW